MPPELTEDQFWQQVTGLASLLGWHWLHVRKAGTGRGWRTPVAGPLGKGWPDLVLMKEGRQDIYAELKSQAGRLRPEQAEVLAFLDATGHRTFVWRPSDIDAIAALLGE